MNKYRYAFTCIIASTVFSAASTPNSHLFNDFTLEFENSWNQFKSGNIEKWSVDSVNNGSGGIKESTRNITTSSSGKPQTFATYKPNGDGTWSPVRQIMIDFDSDNHGFLQRIFSKDSGAASWRQIADTVKLQYNANDKVISWNMSMHDTLGAAVQNISMNVFRNNTDLMDSAIFSVDVAMMGMQMTQLQKIIYTYDGESRYLIITDTSKTIIGGQTSSQEISRSTFTYGLGSMIIIKEKFAQAAWVKEDSINVKYSGDGIISNEEIYSADNQGVWKKDRKIVYTYADNNLFTDTTFVGSNADEWEFSDKSTYYYTEYNGPALPPIDITGIRTITSDYLHNAHKVKPELYLNGLRNSPVRTNSQKYMFNGRAVQQISGHKKAGAVIPLIYK